MSGCAPSEHLDLQSSKNVVSFSCLFLSFLQLVVHGHRPKIYAEIIISKSVTVFSSACGAFLGVFFSVLFAEPWLSLQQYNTDSRDLKREKEEIRIPAVLFTILFTIVFTIEFLQFY